MDNQFDDLRRSRGEQKRAALVKLCREGKSAAIPHMIQFLEDPDPQIRATVAALFGELRQCTQSALPALNRALLDENMHVRDYALSSLQDICRLHGYPAFITKNLIKQFEIADNTLWIRTNSLICLAEMGNKAQAALPTLIKLLNDRNEQIRAHAASALGRFHLGAIKAIPALSRALRDQHETVQRQAASAIEQIHVSVRNFSLQEPAVNDTLAFLEESVTTQN